VAVAGGFSVAEAPDVGVIDGLYPAPVLLAVNLTRQDGTPISGATIAAVPIYSTGFQSVLVADGAVASTSDDAGDATLALYPSVARHWLVLGQLDGDLLFEREVNLSDHADLEDVAAPRTLH
jgi:hypothetical protein